MAQDRLLVDGRDVAAVEVAATAASRARGLLGRDHLEGAILLRPSAWVHTFRMRFAIDVAHLDRDGRVLHVATLAPGRLGRFVPRSRAVLEAAAGRFASWGVEPGVTVEVVPGRETPSSGGAK